MDTRNSFSLQPPSPFTNFFTIDPKDQMTNASNSKGDDSSDYDDEEKYDGSSDSDGGDSDDGNHRWHSTGTYSSWRQKKREFIPEETRSRGWKNLCQVAY